GVCYRLWEEAATGSLEAYQRPEILSADLAPLVLDCAAWGVADPRTLAFLHPPPAPALNEARAMLAAPGGGVARCVPERCERFRPDRSSRAADMRRLAAGWARMALPSPQGAGD